MVQLPQVAFDPLAFLLKRFLWFLIFNRGNLIVDVARKQLLIPAGDPVVILIIDFLVLLVNLAVVFL